jgi:hypothetical protein
MWINPENVTITQPFQQQKQHTAGSIVTYHYRKDVATMSVSGKVGWIMIQSVIEEARNSVFNAAVQGINGKPVTAFDRTVQNFNPAAITDTGIGPKNAQSTGGTTYSPFRQAIDPTTRNGSSSRLNNSPRLFLDRLKTLANEPAYYVDNNGIEHYNVKYIKMFTKQYPNGVICEGYFTNFVVTEASEDAQTIAYNFEFVIENIKPVTIIQRLAGMFSDIGSAAGDAVGLVGNFF